jgi:beta-exotoxin I transport system permease protein
MQRSVFAKTLWDQRRSLIAWVAGITVVGVIYAAFYPLVNTPDMEAALKAYPPGVLDAMGFTDLASPAGYLGSTTFGLLGPALVIVMAAVLGSGAIAGDEESGRLELTLTHPVSRWAVVVGRFAALVVAMLALGAVLTIALSIASGPADLDAVGVANIAAGSVHLAVLGTLFGALALGTGAATGRRSLAYAVVAVTAIIGFFGNNLGPTVEGLGWLQTISPFHYYSGGLPLRHGIQPADLAVLALATAVLVGVGGLIFDRRDTGV